MESPPQNAGSDCEDGEVSSSEDEGVEKDSVEEAPKYSPKGATTRQREEENDEDLSPQRKKLKLDNASQDITVESISSPSSAGGDQPLEEGEEPLEEGEEPGNDKKEDEEEGEEGEILSDSDEEDVPTETAKTAESKSDDSPNKHSSSPRLRSMRDDRDGSPVGYQRHNKHRYPGHSQSSSSRSSNSNNGSSHMARKTTVRRSTPGDRDRRVGTEIRTRKEGSPFTKKKPKMKAPPPPNSPFWGERKHLLPTPDLSPRTGYNLDTDYPQLPRRLLKEYFPDPPTRFARDSHSRMDGRAEAFQMRPKPTDRDGPVSVAASSKEVTEETVQQEGEATTIASLPSMQELVKGQIFSDTGSEIETPLMEERSLTKPDSLADVFSEDFPLLDGEATSNQAEPSSLKNLITGSGVDITIAAGEHKENLNTKVARQVHKQTSAKKQVKATAWHNKQKAIAKQKEIKENEKALQPCKYFINGFCKSGDSCSYSHAAPLKQKKKEVCRYYVGDNCTKGDDCPYLHETFPCKFFHSRNFCIHGDGCRFSHAPLTDETRELLAAVLQQDTKLSASTPTAMINANIDAPPQPQPPQPTPLMSVDTSAMAPLVGMPLMPQDHPPRPPWEGLPPPQLPPPPMMIPPNFPDVPPPRLPPDPSLRPPDQKLGILPTPPAYMKLVPGNPPPVQAPSLPPMNINISTAAQDPRSSGDPRMSQQNAQKLPQGIGFIAPLNEEVQPPQQQQQQQEIPQEADTTVEQEKVEGDEAGDNLPHFQPLEPPKEVSRHKPHFIPDLPTSAVTDLAGVDASLPSHLARPSNVTHHAIDQSPLRPRDSKSKYSHLKVKSRSARPTMQAEEQSQPIITKKDNVQKSILKRAADKPLEPFSMFSQSNSKRDGSPSFGGIQPVFSSRTNVETNKEAEDKAEDKPATDDKTGKDSSVPYYAMFDTGFGSGLQIESAFGSLED